MTMTPTRGLVVVMEQQPVPGYWNLHQYAGRFLLSMSQQWAGIKGTILAKARITLGYWVTHPMI